MWEVTLFSFEAILKVQPTLKEADYIRVEIRGRAHWVILELPTRMGISQGFCPWSSLRDVGLPKFYL